MDYHLSGTVLDACQCGVMCPCWLGEDPDEGEHHAINAYRLVVGRIGALDVSGLNVINVVYVPGSLFLPATWQVVRLVDGRASDKQRDALLSAFRGEFGGPLADLAQLVGNEIAVETVPVEGGITDGAGRLSVPDVLELDVKPYRGPNGAVTTLRDGIFSTDPGSAAWVSRASQHRVHLPRHGMTWEYRGRSAIQAEWRVASDLAADRRRAISRSGADP